MKFPWIIVVSVITAMVMPTVQIPRGRSTARAIRDILEMGSCVLVN